MYTFGLHLFSFFDAHASQVWSFDGITKFSCIPLVDLESSV
jgi:hypothetical protein